MTAEINANSTIDQIYASYRNNASYEEEGDVTKAKRFITAVRFLLGMAKRERKGGASGAEHEFDLETLREELKDARNFVVVNRTDDSPAVLDVDFSEFDART
jgi:hypothetical protein